MEIQKFDVKAWLEDAVQMQTEISNSITEVKCACCKNKMRFPVVARQADVDAFQVILKIANQYLSDNGGSAKMLKEIKGRLAAELALLNSKGKFILIQGGKRD